MHAPEPRHRGRRVAAFALAAIVVLFLGAVTVFGLSGTNADRDACNHDARSVAAAIQAYFSDHHVWPAAGPVDKNSVLLLAGPNGPYLRAAPSSDKYSINTDGAGSVLVAVPPAPSGGINYDDASNPCDAISDD